MPAKLIYRGDPEFSKKGATLILAKFPKGHFRAHLHLAMRLRCRCDIAPNGSQSDSPATSQSLGVTVQHQNNRLDLGAMTQRRHSRCM